MTDRTRMARKRWMPIQTLLLALMAGVSVAPGGASGAGGAVAQQAGTGGADAQLAAAQDLFDQHRAEEAAAAFRHANEAAGGHCGRCLLGLGRALWQTGERDAAIAATREAAAALAGDPRQVQAYVQLGFQLLDASDTPKTAAEAEASFGKAMQLDASSRAAALAGIAEARLQLEHYQPAIDAAEESLSSSRTGESAARARSANCRARRGDDLPSKAFALPTVDLSPFGDARAHATVDSPLRVGGQVTKPVKVYAPAPFYTEEARKMRLQGVVIIEAVIDRQGCIAADRILKGMPAGLDRAALAAAEKWVFTPATLLGQPVNVYYTLTINFQVQ